MASIFNFENNSINNTVLLLIALRLHLGPINIRKYQRTAFDERRKLAKSVKRIK